FVNPAAYEFHLEGPGAGTISDDHGSSPWSATPVALGSVTSGVIDTEGDLDFFKFTVTNTANYVMYTRGTANTFGILYDGSYNELCCYAEDDNSGENIYFRIVWNLAPVTSFPTRRSSDLFVNPAAYEFHLEGPGAGTISDDHGS